MGAEQVRTLNLRFCYSLGKSAEHPNEDNSNYDRARQTFAVCDGASISFDSARWSRIVADKFVVQPMIDQQWLRDARTDFASAYDFDVLPWHHQAAFEIGSFTTLLGLSYDQSTGNAIVIGIGDSVIVVLEGGKWVTSFPYDDPIQFREDPLLLSSKQGDIYPIEAARQQLSFAEHPGEVTILIMSDALGEWCLSRQIDGALQLAEMDIQSDFELFVRTEQAAKRMKMDDVTLMVMTLGSST